MVRPRLAEMALPGMTCFQLHCNIKVTCSLLLIPSGLELLDEDVLDRVELPELFDGGTCGA